MKIINRPDLKGLPSAIVLFYPLIETMFGGGEPSPMEVELALVRTANKTKALKRRSHPPNDTISHAQRIAPGVFRRWL